MATEYVRDIHIRVDKVIIMDSCCKFNYMIYFGRINLSLPGLICWLNKISKFIKLYQNLNLNVYNRIFIKV